MKNKRLGMMAIFLSLLAMTLIFFYLVRTPVFDVEHDGEMNHSLFSQLDPLLGYAHNENYVQRTGENELHIHFQDNEYIHYKNGFVGMNFRADKNPLTIVILGSSSSDPYLFDGNWPLKFHQLLVQKNIPHRIFNGAVSGYNSHQMLNKLMRDVFQIKTVNLVISYFGGNDYPGNEDITENHPNIHPYQIKLYNQLSVSSMADVSLFENLKMVIGRLMGKSKTKLQLGIEDNNYSKNLAMNIRYMKAICDENKVPFFHFMEGVIVNESQRIIGSKLTVKNPTLEKDILSFLTATSLELKNSEFVFSLQDKIPTDKTIFYDSVHLSQEGNEIIASLIYSSIIPENYLGRQR